MSIAATAPTADGAALRQRFGPVYVWLVTLTVMSGGIAMGLASSMVNVAVPSVVGAFGVGLDQAQWMATGFLATMSVSMLVSSWLIEVLGQRITFIAILTIFGVGSFMSAVAPNIDILIAGRILQGAANGVGQPLAMFTMFSVFPPEKRGMAIGIQGLVSVLAPTFGPIVGGIAIDSISWRYLFFLPLPFCVPAMMMGLVFMPTKKLARRLPPFDWIGLAMVLIIVFSAFSAISNGPRTGWDADSVVYRLWGSAAGLVIFILWELRAPYPLLDLSLFRNPQFALTMMAGFVFGAGLFASGYFIPIFVQTIQNYSATRAGLLLATGGVVMMIFFPLSGRITDSIPAHIPIATGERLTTQVEFARILKLQAASILQMNLGRVGGILEAKKIAGMAEAHYAQIAPHLYCGPVVGAANIQLATCSPNFLILESIRRFEGFHAEILKTPIQWEDGYVIPPTAPGLGVELDEEVAARNPYDGAALHLDMGQRPL